MKKTYTNKICIKFTFIVWSCLINMTNGQNIPDEKRLKVDVDNFNMQLGFASSIGTGGVAEFCEFVDEQKEQIASILASMEMEADRIKRDDKPDQRKLEMLLALRKRQDNELREVLLPYQINRLEKLPFYNIVLHEEGFANSVVNGFIAELLDLSVEDRRAIKNEADTARQKYKEVLRKAQLAAIKQIRESIPEGKVERYDELVEPFLHGDRTFWPLDDAMLDTSRRARSNAHLERLK